MGLKKTFAPAAFAMASVFAIGALPAVLDLDASRAGDNKTLEEVEVLVDDEEKNVDTSDAGQSEKTGAKASASASASSHSSSKGNGSGCSSRASSTASATADGKTDYQHEEDHASDAGDGCSAQSHSSATATTDGKD